MDRAQARKFLQELPIAIALLLAGTIYLTVISAPFADRMTSEHVRDVLAMAD